MKIRKLNFRGLGFRYGLFFTLATLLIFMIALYYTFVFARNSLLIESEKDAKVLTNLTISKIEMILQPIENTPKSLALALENNELSFEEAQSLMKDFVLINTDAFGSCLAFEPGAYKNSIKSFAPYYFEDKGRIRYKDLGKDKTYQYLLQPWYSEVKKSLKPVWIEPYIDVGGGDSLMCTYSVPFFMHEKGKRIFSGVITMDISLSSLQDIVSRVHVLKSGYGFLLSRKGKIITFPRKEMVNRNVEEISNDKKNPDLITGGQKMLSGNVGFDPLDPKRNPGPQKWICYAPVPSTGWAFGLIFTSDELFADFIPFFYKLFLVFGLSILAAFIFTVIITRRFMKPIRQLADAARSIGRGNFQAPLPVYHSRDELSQLSNSFLLMQEELGTYVRNLKETTVAKEKIESELKVAREIQERILPKSFPVRPDCDIYAELEPALAVGGDLYDFFFAGDEVLYLAAGDVSGKGVPASLIMAIVRTLFHSGGMQGMSLEAIMTKINREISRENPNMLFVTFVAARVDIRTGSVEIANAGHNYPFLIRKEGTPEPIVPAHTSLPFGIVPQANYASVRIQLFPGDAMAFYTDGITEAMDPDGNLFGEQRLRKAITPQNTDSSRSISKRILGEVREFVGATEQSDDITFMAFRYLNSRLAPEVKFLEITNQIRELEKFPGLLDPLGEEWSLTQKMILEMNLILEEWVTNIIFYAYEDDEEHLIWIEVGRNPSGILIRITDDGREFDLLTHIEKEDKAKGLDERKIGGLGIPIICSRTDDLTYQREAGRNILTVKKKIS